MGHGYCQHMGDGNCELEDRLASLLGVTVQSDGYDELSRGIAEIQRYAGELQARIDHTITELEGVGKGYATYDMSQELIAILSGVVE